MSLDPAARIAMLDAYGYRTWRYLAYNPRLSIRQSAAALRWRVQFEYFMLRGWDGDLGVYHRYRDGNDNSEEKDRR